MKLKIALFAVIFATFSVIAFTEQSKAQQAVSIDLFYQELSPYGQWTPHPEFGYIWQPYQVGPEWKPYTDGRWEWSDQGWLWISYEPWGWATYHYGRWVFDDYQGWIWIPGTTWAPAWVSWQQSPEYIGWSPLPPDRGFFIEIGFVFNSFNNYYYKPYRNKYYGHNHHHHKHRKHKKKHHYYHDYYKNPRHYKAPARHSVYMPHKKFGHHKHAGKAAIPPDNFDIVLRNNRNVTNIKRVNNKVINYGPDKHFIEKRSNRKLVNHKIINKDKVRTKGNKNVNIVKGNTYNAYRPRIQRSNRDPFTTNRNQVNRSGSNRKSVNPGRVQQTQLDRKSPKLKLNSNKINQRSNKTFNNKNVTKMRDIRGNQPTTSRKINNQGHGKNTPQRNIRNSSKGYDKYSYKNRPNGQSKKLEFRSAPKNNNFRGNNVSINKNRSNKTLNISRKNTNAPNINKKSGFRQSNKQYKGTNRISNNKHLNRSYSNKRSQIKKAKTQQNRSYKPNVRTMQTPKNPSFSRR